MKYLYQGVEYTRETLEAEVEQEAASLDPEQWLFGEFEFAEWLSDAIVTGSVTRVEEDL